jgi:hypothetical protein
LAIWGYDPHTGGNKVPQAVQERVRARILAYAAKGHPEVRIDVRFKGALCYVDAYRRPQWVPPPERLPPGMTREQYIERVGNTPIHLVRMRYFAEDRWSLAFFRYSNEKYEPCVFHSGGDFGTPEEAFDVGARSAAERQAGVCSWCPPAWST